MKNLIGQKFGKLTVIEKSTKKASNGGLIWICQCECGNTVEVTSNNLRRKKNPTQSCGCKTSAIDLTNQKFGSLTAIEPTEQRVNGKVVWKCLCDCGNEHFVTSANLKSGSVKSCGKCSLTNENKTKTLEYRVPVKGDIINNWEIIEKLDEKKDKYYLYKCKCIKCGTIKKKKITEIKQSKSFCDQCRRIDRTGNKYEKLTVLKLDQERTTSRKTFWICQCECGNIVSVNSSNLESGNTKSCGCLNFSLGEEKIKTILQQHNIKYETQKTFNSCRFIDTNALARFDFYLPDYNILIEYDGIQHFKKTGYGNLQETQTRDLFKTNWCKDNNITLIRIPYTQYDNITLEQLLNQ